MTIGPIVISARGAGAHCSWVPLLRRPDRARRELLRRPRCGAGDRRADDDTIVSPCAAPCREDPPGESHSREGPM